MKFRNLIIGATLMLFGCGGVDPSVYENKKPEITVKDFFGSTVYGYGIFQSRSGEVKDRYYGYLIPTWNGNEGTFVEKQWNEEGKLFLHQTWHIKVSDDGKSFTATADQIDGVLKGQSNGYALRMQYTLKVPRDNGKEVNIDADDWTYLQPNGLGINKIALSKFGFHVGDISYTFQHLAHGESLHEGYFPPVMKSK